MGATERQKVVCGLVALLLLVGWGGWLFVQSDHDPARGIVFHADFNFVGGLQAGATVRRSGHAIGHVLAIRTPGSAGRHAARRTVRVDFVVRRAAAHLVRKGSEVFVAATGLLGERFLAIGPPPRKDASAAPANAIFRGSDPAPLDRLLNVSWYRVGDVVVFLRALAEPLERAKRAWSRLEGRRQRLVRLGQRAAALEKRFVDIQKRARSLAGSASGSAGPMLARGQKLYRLIAALRAVHDKRFGTIARHVRQIAKLLNNRDLFWSATDRRKLKSLGQTVRATLVLLASSASQSQKLLSHLTNGSGTLGKLINDKELNDDLKDSHRVLRKAPWRVLGAPGRGAPLHRPPRAPRRRELRGWP